MKKVLIALCLVTAIAGTSMGQTTPAPQQKEKPKQEAKKETKKEAKHVKHHHAKVTKSK